MSYILQNPAIITALLWDHLLIAAVALAISVLIALPAGLLVAPRPRLAGIVLGFLGVIYTVPSIALIILLIPFFGLNARSVIVALVLYSQIILVRNIVTGLRGIDPMLLDAAKGMGMNAWQRWWRVQLPLAFPVMLAGMRLATVVTIAIATIGAKFGAGGLGTLLFDGIAQNRYDKILAGSIIVAALALVLNKLLLELEKAFDPKTKIRRAERQQQAAVSPAPVEP